MAGAAGCGGRRVSEPRRGTCQSSPWGSTAVTARKTPSSIPRSRLVNIAITGLIGMSDVPESPPAASLRGESSLTAGGVIQGGAHLRGEGRLVAGGTIRDAVQELHDSSREQLRQLLIQLSQAPRTIVAIDGHDEDLAAQAESSGMPSVAKLIRAAAKFGIVTVIAAIISGPVSNEEDSIMHWTPPPVTKIQQM